MGRLTSPHLVGREEELGRFQRAFDLVVDRKPQVVLVSGAAGIGKTRLVEEFVGGLDRAMVLRGGCMELGGGALPYEPMVAVLRELAGVRGEDGVGRLLTGPRRELQRLLPGRRSASSDEELPAANRLHDAVRSLFELLAEDEPLVVVLEDLHWAGQSILDLVTFLSRNLVGASVLLVATFREEELSDRPQLREVLTELTRLRAVERLHLEPLSDAAVTRLVAGILGDLPDPGRLRMVVQRSEGIAFFVEELLASSARDLQRLPSTLKHLFEERLRGLSDDAMEVLRISAVAGRAVDDGLLEEVAELPRQRVREGLRDAVQAEVLVPNGMRLHFRHALLADAVSESVLPAERVRLHRGFLDALASNVELAEDDGLASHAEIAHHALAAEQYDRAYTATLRAAERAQTSCAFHEAHEHLELALDLFDTVDEATREAGPRHVELLRMAARVSTVAGNVERSISLLRSALDEHGSQMSADQRSAMLQDLASDLQFDGQASEALQVAAEAVDTAPAGSAGRAEALTRQALTLTLLERADAAEDAAREGFALAQEVGTAGMKANALMALGLVLGRRGEHGQAVEHLRMGIDVARADDLVDLTVRLYINLNSELAGRGRLDESQAVAREGIAFAEEAEHDGMVPDFLRCNLADGLVDSGRLQEAEAHLRRVQVRREPGVYLGIHTIAETTLQIMQGQFDLAEERLGLAMPVLAVFPDPQLRIPLAELEVFIAMQAGDLDDAWKLLAEARELRADRDAGFERLRPLAARVEADRVTGKSPGVGVVARTEERLDTLREELDAMIGDEPEDSYWAAQLRTAILQVEAERTRANGTPNPDAWMRAEEGVGAQGRLTEVLYLRIRRAEALVGCDRRDDGAVLLGDVDEECRDRGLVWLGDQTHALARRARISLPGVDDPGDSFGLTARERDVLDLVAEGMTNRQIGEQLFITAKTASTHVSNILAKLGVATRGEASALAHRRGLVRSSA